MKKFELLAVEPKENALNIPIFWAMTNGMMAHAITEEIKLQEIALSTEQAEAVKTFLKGLKTLPEDLFIDPCLGECPDAFVLAFGFKNYKD